jgi:antitoxin StbD
MAMRSTPTEVLPTSEARALLTSITAQFREHGAACGPVLFGSHRVPEAALVPYELVELLDPIIEDLVIAARVRQRRTADDGLRYSIDEVAAELGIAVD